MSSRITYCKDIYYFQVFLLVPAKGLNQFSSVFATPSANHVISDVTSFFYADEHSNLNQKPKLTTINFTKEDVESAIKSLKINSAPGPEWYDQ